MPKPLIKVYPKPPDRLFDAVIDAARLLGLKVTNLDPSERSLTAARPATSGSPQRLKILVTDNAFGGSTVHVETEGRRVMGRGSLGRRLLRRTTAVMGRPGPGPTP